MLFQYKREEEMLSLAYLQYFQCLKRDTETGMWIAERTDKYEVLPVSALVRNVHFVPFFDSSTTHADNPFDNVYSYDMYLVNCFSDKFAFKYFS
jgi:hypothetical protein